MSPENQWLEDVISYWNSPFLGDMLVFGGVRDYEKPSLGGAFQIFFILTPNLGEMIQFE